LAGRAHAAQVTNADFTFESNLGQILPTAFITGPTSATTAIFSDIRTSFLGPMSADFGTGSFYGVNAATQTSPQMDFSSGNGNGSFRSLEVSGWNLGDYYRFDVPTTGIMSILVSFNQVSSSTPPGEFSLAYSVDGTSFSTFTTYAVGSGPIIGWVGLSSAVTFTNQVFSFNLSAITGLNNDPNARFRIVDADTLTGLSATKSWLDNVVVSGTAIPEPASLSLMTVAAAAIALKRRSK
jgi:hypothetical protein